MIVFAGTSHLYLPLTTDYEAALLFLHAIDTKMIPNQGTSISSAMDKAIDIVSRDEDKYKVVLLVTDGEDHEGDAINLAKKASEIGIEIHIMDKDETKMSINETLIKEGHAYHYEGGKKKTFKASEWK